ncbi:MAG: DUF4870 domain-containing protein [Saprospirales bacterium]|nr:DUF4870 domain-containing protein [Saprospirales bacterium]
MFATFAHLGMIAGFVFPLGNIIVPLVIWLTQRDKSDFVDAHAKEALNWQLTVTILAFGGIILSMLIIGIPLLIMLGLACLVFSILAAIKANEGSMYAYPFNFRIIK